MNIKHDILPNLRSIKAEIIVESITNNEEPNHYEYDDIKKIADDLENVCYKCAIDYILPSTEGFNNPLCEEIYHLKVARIIGFFDDSTLFTNLFKKIYNKTISINDLPDVNVAELFPEKYTRQLARINETGKDIPVKYSTLYQCGKCKLYKGYIHKAQTRSLDESNTIFVNCLSCGFEFSV